MIQKNRKGGLTYGGHHIHLHGVRCGAAALSRGIVQLIEHLGR